jgi:hypothetical protein
LTVFTKIIWTAPWQNHQSAFATSMDPDQHAHRHSLIRIHAVHLQTLFQVEKLMANIMDPDQTAQMQRLDPYWSQTHYVGFVMVRLKSNYRLIMKWKSDWPEFLARRVHPCRRNHQSPGTDVATLSVAESRRCQV